MATLSIIDLAGSERAAATSNMGQRMVEGANINKSLLALGNCINALCENGGATRHVPYRNSKLTRLLKFSLGGNCKTVMIVCVAPTSNHFDDTHNTLLYAERATKIKTKVVTRNVVNVDRHVGRYVEAINRLNIEVAELKAKLAGKLGSEGDIARRKKAEANAEVERAKNEMQTKADQTQASIVDGASCNGKITAANAKLRVIQSRLTQIDAQASYSLSSDLEAERALLQALAAPEEQALKPESALNVRLKRSSNSGHMFEATLRAVSERRSDRLDDVSVDNVKMDARWQNAEMERVKAEAERDAMKDAVETQAEMVVNLVGMVGRCTVMIGEAGRLLRSAVEEGRDGMEGTVRAMAASLKSVAEKNDEAFGALVGHSTASYMRDERSVLAIDAFKGHTTSFMRVSSAPTLQPPKARSRRSLSYGSPPRRTSRTPRKSLRSSISQPYRRVSDKEKDKKSVQWRDEVGQGDLDDRGQPRVDDVFPLLPPSISVTTVDGEGGTPTSGTRVVSSSGGGGSESEWEDEKTEDSLNMSFMSSSTRSNTLPLGRMMNGVKRPRASRLDPGFLKAKGASMLGSLAEDDENTSPVKRGAPLSDRSVNQLHDSQNSGAGNGRLHIPKGRDRYVGSPSRRAPSTPRIAGSATKSGRRRLSNIGPMRAKRRSSMIPKPLGSGGEEGVVGGGGARRVEMGSPVKMSRKVSLLGLASRGVSSSSASVTAAGSGRVTKSPMLIATNSMSMKGAAPSWR
jgi:kinesin family protein 18/19